MPKRTKSNWNKLSEKKPKRYAVMMFRTGRVPTRMILKNGWWVSVKDAGPQTTLMANPNDLWMNVTTYLIVLHNL